MVSSIIRGPKSHRAARTGKQILNAESVTFVLLEGSHAMGSIHRKAGCVLPAKSFETESRSALSLNVVLGKF